MYVEPAHEPTNWLPVGIEAEITTDLLTKVGKQTYDALVKAGNVELPMGPEKGVSIDDYLYYFTPGYLGSTWVETWKRPGSPVDKPLTGTLPKRIHKFFYYMEKRYSTPWKALPSEFIELFGSKMQDALNHGQNIVKLAFAHDFNWERGTYGDSGSCYWTIRNGARRMLREEGFLSAHFKSSKQTGRGIVAPLVPRQDGGIQIVKPEDAEFLIFMNNYGVPTGIQTKVLMKYLNRPEWISKSVTVLNNGRKDGHLLYANQATGTFIGPKELVDKTGFDFQIDDNKRCAACGGSTTDGEDDPDGLQGCICAGKSATCVRCSKRRHINYLTRYRRNPNSDAKMLEVVYVCKIGDCARQPVDDFWQCSHCGHHFISPSCYFCLEEGAPNFPAGYTPILCFECVRRVATEATVLYCREHSRPGRAGEFPSYTVPSIYRQGFLRIAPR